MQTKVEDQNFLDSLFPKERTDAFFDALFGGAEDGAYDIKLVFRHRTDAVLNMAFELHQRPGKCLRCNLTYGLPQVFARHPVLDLKGVAAALGQAMGWENIKWELGSTEEHSDALHCIPFKISRS